MGQPFSPERRFRAAACLAAAVIVALAFAAAFPATGQRVPNVKAGGVVLPFYSKGRPSAVAVLRVKKVFKDSRRVGFFKVRLLPVVACEDVHLEVLHPESSAVLFDELDAGLRRLGGTEQVELRQFKITFPGEPNPRLQARRARVSEKGDLLHLEQATLSDLSPVPIARATLKLRSEPGHIAAPLRGQEVDYDLLAVTRSTNSFTPKGDRP